MAQQSLAPVKIICDGISFAPARKIISLIIQANHISTSDDFESAMRELPRVLRRQGWGKGGNCFDSLVLSTTVSE
jgi:hypothetical protein